MTKDNDAVSRRNVLKAGGTAGALALVGGAGVFASTGSAAATTVAINTNSVSATTPDGDIKKVFISPQGGVEWKNFDEAVDHISITVRSRVTTKDETALTGWRTAYDTTFALGDYAGLAGDFDSHNLGEIVLYGEGAGSTAPFDVAEDGDSLRRRVELDVTVDLLHGDRLADPKEEAHIVETAAFYADSTNAEASSGITVDANGGME